MSGRDVIADAIRIEAEQDLIAAYDAESVTARILSALAPAGYAVVPVEPSIEQLDRALHDMGCPNPKMSRQQLRDFYRAMLAAAAIRALKEGT